MIERLAGFTDTVLAGITVFFTVVSAYVAALNYFISRTSIIGRVTSFLFVTFILLLLIAVMHGAQAVQSGLVAGLRELAARGELTAAGRAALANADAEVMILSGQVYSVDALVRAGLWGGMGLTYLGLFFLTFVFRWGDED